MRIEKTIFTTAALALGWLASTASAQVNINAPGVRVRVGGGGVNVIAPGVRVNQGGAGVQVLAPGTNVDTTQTQNLPPRDPNKEAFVGLFCEPISEAAAAQLGDQIINGRALIVTQVLPGSPAQKGNIGKHDVLLSYDGHGLDSVEQFQSIIRADYPGRTVRIDILRAGRRYSASVVLGSREIDHKPVKREQSDSNVGVNVLGRVIVGRSGVDAPGAVIRWGTPAEVEFSDGSPKTCSVTVDRREAGSWSVLVTFTGPDDKVVEKFLEGTVDQIRSRLDEFPPTVAEQVRRTLERVENDKTISKGVKVNVQPRVQGDVRGLHVSILRPGKEGGIHLFELDRVYKSEKKIKVDDLLQINVFVAELRELDPAVREQVEETLREVQIPEVKVDVRRSL